MLEKAGERVQDVQGDDDDDGHDGTATTNGGQKKNR